MCEIREVAAEPALPVLVVFRHHVLSVRQVLPEKLSCHRDDEIGMTSSSRRQESFFRRRQYYLTPESGKRDRIRGFPSAAAHRWQRCSSERAPSSGIVCWDDLSGNKSKSRLGCNLILTPAWTRRLTHLEGSYRSGNTYVSPRLYVVFTSSEEPAPGDGCIVVQIQTSKFHFKSPRAYEPKPSCRWDKILRVR